MDRTLEEFKRQAGILGKSVPQNEKKTYAIVNTSFHNAKFSDRIWMYQDMMKTELSKLLQQGLRFGKTSEKAIWSQPIQCRTSYDHRACKSPVRSAETIF